VGKKVVGVLLAVALVLAGGACIRTGGGPEDDATTTTVRAATTIPLAQLQPQASQIVDFLAAAKYDDVVSFFSAEMLLSMSATSLKTAWESVAAQFGPYKSRSATTVSTASVEGATAVFDTPVTFGTVVLKCRVGFDADGKVASLRVIA
jgi:hypothetical protein